MTTNLQSSWQQHSLKIFVILTLHRVTIHSSLSEHYFTFSKMMICLVKFYVHFISSDKTQFYPNFSKTQHQSFIINCLPWFGANIQTWNWRFDWSNTIFVTNTESVYLWRFWGLTSEKYNNGDKTIFSHSVRSFKITAQLSMGSHSSV